MRTAMASMKWIKIPCWAGLMVLVFLPVFFLGCATQEVSNDQQLQRFNDLLLRNIRQEQIELVERIPFPKSAPDGFSDIQALHYFKGFSDRLTEFIEFDFSLKSPPSQYDDDKENLEAWMIGRRVASFLIGNELKKKIAEARAGEEHKLEP